MVRTQQQQHQEFNRVFCELSSLILSVIRYLPGPDFSSGEESLVIQRRLPPMTPGGFAALLMGVSMAMMLCGSVTFFIGFMLLPWVLCLVMVLYVVGVLSSLSTIGRAILCCCFSVTLSSLLGKAGPAWKLL